MKYQNERNNIISKKILSFFCSISNYPDSTTWQNNDNLANAVLLFFDEHHFDDAVTQ